MGIIHKNQEKGKIEYKNKKFQYGKNLISSIKSLFIIKYIFSHISEKRKLNFIIYNKFYQNKFGLDIDYYKNISGKYIIHEKNGISKVYKLNTNILIYEGEYLKGERTGKGKEYYLTGKVKFEGEFFNGDKIEGKEYDDNGNLILSFKNNGEKKEFFKNGILQFDGEYLNGKKWNGKGYNDRGIKIFEIKNGRGFVNEYDPNGILKFKGEYLDGERNGKGKQYHYNGGLQFEGEYLNGVRNGRGKEYLHWNGELIYEGEYLNGVRNGRGKEY